MPAETRNQVLRSERTGNLNGPVWNQEPGCDHGLSHAVAREPRGRPGNQKPKPESGLQPGIRPRHCLETSTRKPETVDSEASGARPNQKLQPETGIQASAGQSHESPAGTLKIGKREASGAGPNRNVKPKDGNRNLGRSPIIARAGWRSGFPGM